MNERLVKTFCNLVRIDSESGEEAPFIEHLRGLFAQELGATCTLDSYGNLIARVPGKGSKRREPIVLGAHADTVKPGKGIEPVIAGGVIRSSGGTILGADDKAGIAEILEGVRTAERRPPVEILITRGEEIGLQGAKNLDPKAVTAKTGFIFDSDSLDTVIVGGPTHISFDIEIVGRAAHAGMEPEKGISAIRVAAKAIASFPEGRLDEETTANVGTIQGGLIRNGVPERVTIQAECRSLDHEKCLRQAKLMRTALEKEAKAAGATVEVKESMGYKASRVPEDSPLVQAAKAAIAAAGLEPKTKVITGGTDALVLGEKGIQAVVLGTGEKNAHSTSEEIAIADLEKVVEIIRELLHALA
jgi:tripeptide aminopeptidase